MNIDPVVLARAQSWINSNLDEDIKSMVHQLINKDPDELTDAFYRDLEFGTGGLRGIMGVGTNRMNKVTVSMATQGLANYLKKVFVAETQISVAIAFDSRNNSSYFARIASEVLSANGIMVFLFEHLRPTPLLSFAVRYLNCQSGIVITASHNPKEYNGYKVYWNDGGQLVPPHDMNVIDEVRKIKSFNEVSFEFREELISIIGADIDHAYLKRVRELSLSPELIARQRDLKIVYTPLHGTGSTLVPQALKGAGFTNVILVDEQCVPDGNFPTVKSPNPEEPAALHMAIDKAKAANAELVMATDPDADRVGIAVRIHDGEFVLLNGNQTASILIWYLLKQWKDKGKLAGREYIVKTIVTSELLKDIAGHFGVECMDVLTGFKYIAEIIRLNESKKTFIGGGEESYGYLVGDFVRDKDAVISCCMIAEAAAYAKDQGKTLFELLQDIYLEYGMYYEGLLSVTKKGKSGAEEIKAMMDNYRSDPYKEIAGSKVVMIKDYKLKISADMITGSKTPVDLPESDVMQFFLDDGSKITVRPSGTEPKIKFYFGVKAIPAPGEMLYETEIKLKERIKKIIGALKLE